MISFYINSSSFFGKNSLNFESGLSSSANIFINEIVNKLKAAARMGTLRGSLYLPINYPQYISPIMFPTF